MKHFINILSLALIVSANPLVPIDAHNAHGSINARGGGCQVTATLYWHADFEADIAITRFPLRIMRDHPANLIAKWENGESGINPKTLDNQTATIHNVGNEGDTLQVKWMHGTDAKNSEWLDFSYTGKNGNPATIKWADHDKNAGLLKCERSRWNRDPRMRYALCYFPC